jgi:hypothetical protein
MPASKQQSEAQVHFARAAASMTTLYKLAHAASSAGSALNARDDVRRFARMAAVEIPGAAERHRGRRFVALDELIGFLDSADATLMSSTPHVFGRKRSPPAERAGDAEAEQTQGTSRHIRAPGSNSEPALRRHRTQQDQSGDGSPCS